jgi:glyceraldehyde 3-phosphate dehydrogenase
MVRIGINGFGRIGRAFLRLLIQEGREAEVVAVNDLGDVHGLAYLLKYDSVYGKAPFEVSVDGSALVVHGKKIQVLAEKEPAKIIP